MVASGSGELGWISVSCALAHGATQESASTPIPTSRARRVHATASELKNLKRGRVASIEAGSGFRGVKRREH
jgi:hypothetical protein